EPARAAALLHAHAEARCAANQLVRHGRRVGETVLPARDGVEHVVVTYRPGDSRALARHPERPLQHETLLEPLDARRRGREEHVADLLEVRRPGLLAEPDQPLRGPPPR